MSEKTEKWKRLYRSETCTHLFVRTGILDHKDHTYICDNSGAVPSTCDDGPLRFDAKFGHQPYGVTPKIVLKVSHITGGLYADVPVISERQIEKSTTGYRSWCHVDLGAAMILGRRHNIDVVIETSVYKTPTER